MIWSISSGKAFLQCERQWFYKNVYQQWNSKKEPLRRRAHILSKLTSISALRGQVVDEVLSHRLVNAFNFRQAPSASQIVSECLAKFDRRIEEARAHRLDEFASKIEKLPDDFTLLHEIHAGRGIEASEIARAREEISLAIENLFMMQDLIDTLKSSSRVIAQRVLQYDAGLMSVRAVPDLIAFFENQPPLVLDWKVHFFANADAAKQLASYALALVKNNLAKPHKDFPKNLGRWSWNEIRLWEAQLLVPTLRVHEYLPDQFTFLEETIASDSAKMSLAVYGRNKASEFSPDDFSAAHDARRCSSCNFKELCWE